MVGSTRNEFSFLIRNADAADTEHALQRILSDTARVERFQRGHAGASSAGLIGQAISDFTFRAPALQLAELSAEQDAPTYLYDFCWRPREGLLGSRHCFDIPFAFDCLVGERVARVAGAAPPQSLADAVHRAWVSFIKTGHAGWKAFRRPERSAMIFDDPERVEQDAMRLERDVWLA
jgi:para-nitrobenzyl esterase